MEKLKSGLFFHLLVSLLPSDTIILILNYLLDTFLSQITVHIMFIECDFLIKLGVLRQEIPIPGNIIFEPECLASIVELGSGMPNEDDLPLFRGK